MSGLRLLHEYEAEHSNRHKAESEVAEDANLRLKPSESNRDVGLASAAKL